MFHVEVDLNAGDRSGRGRTLQEALATVGKLLPRTVRLVRITWRRDKIIVTAEGSTLQEAQENFIEAMIREIFS